MNNFINRALEAARKYSIWDFGCFKLCLFLIGVIVGTSFYYFLSDYITLLVIVFILTYAWLIYKTFFKYWK